jgi:hypothetical protein
MLKLIQSIWLLIIETVEQLIGGIMLKSLFLSLTVLLTACSSTPPSSDIVLIAAAHTDKQKINAKSPPWQCFKDTNNSVNKKQRFEMILDTALEKETGFSKEQRREALNLVMSGKFTSDLHDLVVLFLSLPSNNLNAIPFTLHLLLRLPEGLYDCLLQRQCKNRAHLVEKANSIYKNPSIKLQRETLVALLDNRSFRLALIAYAHVNGVDIRDEDLTFVQNQLKNEQIDLKSLLNEGEMRLKEKYNIDEVEARLACLER